MRIVSVQPLQIPDIKVIRYERFRDARGYFTEVYRRSDVETHGETAFLRGAPFVQHNESLSRQGTLRGLHFQWKPFMGKLVRTLHGHMIDIVVDIRVGSPTFGKGIMHDMPADDEAGFGEWIWVPPGCAHGNYFPAITRIEYFCTGEYNPGCESGISPLTNDIDWRLCDPRLKESVDAAICSGVVISDKDRQGLSLTAWRADSRSSEFVYGRC